MIMRITAHEIVKRWVSPSAIKLTGCKGTDFIWIAQGWGVSLTVFSEKEK